MTKLFNQTNK